MNPLYRQLETSIFEEMSQLAREHGAINLGQGFPDGDGPEEVRRAAAAAIMAGENQYPPSRGRSELREAVAGHYRRFHGVEAEPDQVLVTSGATEALAAAILALVSPGDEVVIVQPAYDAYLPLVRQAGGVPRFVTLRPPECRLRADDLARAIGPRTRAIILNNPHNPLARVFDRAELDAVAGACLRHDLVAICDEVWEHVLFDGREHLSLIAFPGMAERTVKIGSAGKIFSMTGWKVGFVVAAPDLLEPIARAHQYLMFATPPALQLGVAHGLALPDAHFEAMRAGYARSRDLLAGDLEREGFALLPSEGTYFLCLDLAASGIGESDRAFCRRMVEEAGVAMIPLSPFYAEDPAETLVRLCFAKADATLIEAAGRLGRAARG